MKKLLKAFMTVSVSGILISSLCVNVFAESTYEENFETWNQAEKQDEAQIGVSEYFNQKGITLDELLREPEDENVLSEMAVKVFPDVKQTSWYYDSVQYVAGEEIITGYSNGKFGPNDRITREQFATILYRMSGEYEESEDTSFYSDAEEMTYYNRALVWARKNNIAKGYGDSAVNTTQGINWALDEECETYIFGIGDPIKRQDIATMLYRYAEHEGYQTHTKEKLAQFSDRGYVSSYANEALQWAVSIGILTGKSSGSEIDPKGYATRAEAAAMIMRYLKIKDYFSEDGTGWTFTQNAEQGGSFGMFYTLYNNEDGYLIVVDSGGKKDYEKVRRILNVYGGHINTWILTHPHGDHIAAFMEIMNDPQGVTVDRVYASPYDNNYFIAGGWVQDRFYTLSMFDTIFSRLKDKKYIYRNDTFEIDGLKFECFNSFDDISKKYSPKLETLANNGSLVLKITGEENTFLFLGDAMSTLESYLMDTYGDRLKADYVQLSHHGYSGNTQWKLYDCVAPKIAFMDAPEWLFEIDEYCITWNYLKRLGAKCYRFVSSPNHISFK